jgi:tagatose-1,6-bisphosphate aldolase non-catalytic subunit AgaZ/GatZ
VLYQGIYTDGPSPKGAHNYSTELNVTDEAAYLQALAQLRTIFDEVGLKDVKISAYRTLAGRTNHSHRVTISTASPERLAAFLDTMATNKKVADWMASTAKIRTVVSSFTAREITK